ncbi:unnamed protein product, partial [marine sediment metagenome]
AGAFADFLDWSKELGKILKIDVSGTVAGLRAFAGGKTPGAAVRIGAGAADARTAAAAAHMGAGLGAAVIGGRAAAGLRDEFVGPLPLPARPEIPGVREMSLAGGEDTVGEFALATAALKDAADAVLASKEVCFQIQSIINMDSRELAHAQAKYQGELKDRTGATLMPWQRRQLLVNAGST